MFGYAARLLRRGATAAKQYVVTLTPEERQRAELVARPHRYAARERTRARIVRLADTAGSAGGLRDAVIARQVRACLMTVQRVRKRFAEGGLEAALSHKPQATRKARMLDGEAEAFLIASVCGAPPAGFERWSLQLLKQRLVAQGYVDSVSHETVRQTLKKNELKPWLKRCWCIPPKANAAFVCAMEDVLDVYQQPADPNYPQVCLDEGAKQLLREVREPVPMNAGQPMREDYEYGQEGVSSFFVLFAPLLGWRHVAVTGRRRAVDLRTW